MGIAGVPIYFSHCCTSSSLGRGSEKEVISELEKIENTIIQDGLAMMSKPEDSTEDIKEEAKS